MSEAPAGSSPRVCVRLDAEAPREQSVADGDTLGRDVDNAVVIEHPSISRHHASLRARADGSFELVDLGSLNGSRVNGRAVQHPTAIHHGDRITLGEVDVVFLHEAGPVRSHEADQALHALRRAGADAQPDDEPRQVYGVVMALDTPAYASLANLYPSARIQAWLDEWWDDARALLDSHGAYVDPTPRDGMIALWCVAHREAPASEVNVALRCAVELWHLARQRADAFETREAESRSSEVAPSGKAPPEALRFEVAVALHLGEVCIAKRNDEDVVIDPVAATQVVQRLANTKSHEPSAAVVSWEVARWAGFGFCFRNLGDVGGDPSADGGALACLALDAERSS